MGRGDDEGSPDEPVEVADPPSWAMTEAAKLLLDHPFIPVNQATLKFMAWQFVEMSKAQQQRPESTTPLEKTAKIKEVHDPAGAPQISKEDLMTIRQGLAELDLPPSYEQGEQMAIKLKLNYDVPAEQAVRLVKQMAEMAQEHAEDPVVAQYIKEELEAYLAEKKKYKDSFYKAKEKKADELMASGTDEDAAYGIADTIVSKQGKKKKKKGNKK